MSPPHLIYSRPPKYIYPSEVTVAKTLVDIDAQTLAEAQTILGTTTKKDTITKALREVIVTAARRREAERTYPDLGNPEIMAGAWR